MRSVLSVSSKPVLRASQAPPGGLLAHFTAAEQVTYMSIFHATAKRCGSGTPNGDAFACGCGAKPPHYLRLSKVAATIQGRDQALFAKLYRLGINQVSAAILARHDIQTRASAWNSRSSNFHGLGGTAERNSTVFGFVLCTECGDAAPLPLGASSAVPPYRPARPEPQTAVRSMTASLLHLHSCRWNGCHRKHSGSRNPTCTRLGSMASIRCSGPARVGPLICLAG
jgi:hypothetical protein